MSYREIIAILTSIKTHKCIRGKNKDFLKAKLVVNRVTT